MPSEPVDEPLEMLAQCVRAIAAQHQLALSDETPELYQQVSRSTQLADDLGIQLKKTTRHSGLTTIGLYVDHYALIIAPLGAQPDSEVIGAKLAAHHRQAAIALTWLPAQYKADLNIFFVGPSGSQHVSEWLDLSARIERDEQICRKMVWLPPPHAEDHELSAQEFCARTFLARPWLLRSKASVPELNPLGNLSSSDPILAEWITAIESADESAPDLVSRFIASWERHHKENGDVP